MAKEVIDKELLELRAQYMDSGRSRRSCTIVKQGNEDEKSKTVQAKKVRCRFKDLTRILFLKKKLEVLKLKSFLESSGQTSFELDFKTLIKSSKN